MKKVFSKIIENKMILTYYIFTINHIVDIIKDTEQYLIQPIPIFSSKLMI